MGPSAILLPGRPCRELRVLAVLKSVGCPSLLPLLQQGVLITDCELHPERRRSDCDGPLQSGTSNSFSSGKKPLASSKVRELCERDVYDEHQFVVHLQKD